MSPLLRLSPESEHRPIHRYQHLYALLAYSTTTLFWVFIKDYKYFLKRDLGPFRKSATEVRGPHPLRREDLLLRYSIVIPLLVRTSRGGNS